MRKLAFRYFLTTGFVFSSVAIAHAQGVSGAGSNTTDTNVAQTVSSTGTAPAKAQGVQSATGTPLQTDATGQAIKAAIALLFPSNGSIGNTGFNALQNGAPNTVTNQFYEQTVGPSMQVPGTAPTVVRGIQGAAGGIAVATAEQGSSSAAVGITPAITQSGTSLVGKTSQGNLYSAYAVLTAAASGQTYLVTINAAAVPASGAAITPVDVAIFPSNAIGATASTNFSGAPPNAYPAGVVTLVTTSLTVYTPGAASFMQDRVR